MKVTNSTPYPLIAFGWHLQRGYGVDVTIQPSETMEVLGPYLGELDGGACHVLIPGEISCQEGADDDDGFQVTLGNQLNLASDDVGITVRHYTEPRATEPVAA